jgi:hypothetical protein
MTEPPETAQNATLELNIESSKEQKRKQGNEATLGITIDSKNKRIRTDLEIQPTAQDEVKKILDALNQMSVDNRFSSIERWSFKQEDNETDRVQNLPPNDFIMVRLSLQSSKLVIDCDVFMECIKREMDKNTKTLVNCKNKIYIKDDKGDIWSIVGVKNPVKDDVPTRQGLRSSTPSSVSNFVNCVDNTDPNLKCKLPEVIKELIWECIEPKMKDLPMNTTWINELRKFYLPEVELQKLVPEEKEPPICDFFKQIRPKSITNTTQYVCDDKMIDYLKTHLEYMREDINKIAKTGKQKETAEFEKSVEMELSGNEIWDMIKSTIYALGKNEFDPNQFINANTNMPTYQANQEVEHKADDNQFQNVNKKENQEEKQEEKKEEVQIYINKADQPEKNLVSQQVDQPVDQSVKDSTSIKNNTRKNRKSRKREASSSRLSKRSELKK